MKRYKKQTLQLNEQGILLSSCDCIFSTEQWLGKNIVAAFPFLESIFSTLQENLNTNQTLVFPKVETSYDFLPGFYDYTFTVLRDPSGKIIYIEWTIVDKSDTYHKVQKNQQVSNEKDAFGDQKLLKFALICMLFYQYLPFEAKDFTCCA